MYQLFEDKLKKQQKNQPIALFSDLDDTFIRKYYPSSQEKQGLSQKEIDLIIDNNPQTYQDSISLYRFLESHSIPFSFVSGRDIYMLKALQQSFKTKLPSLTFLVTPYILAGAVGTELWVLQENGEYIYDNEYEKHLQTKFDYNRPKIYKLAQELIQVINKKYSLIDFKFQKRDLLPLSSSEFPPQKMKVSLEFISSPEISTDIENVMKEFFTQKKINKIQIITSFGFNIDEKRNSYNVDLLPCGKSEPVNYLTYMFDLFPICAGDGGNDEDMIVNTKGYGIVVGGYKKELVDAVKTFKTKKQIYIEANTQNTGPKSLQNAISHFLLSSA